jgi:hypothetical protein
VLFPTALTRQLRDIVLLSVNGSWLYFLLPEVPSNIFVQYTPFSWKMMRTAVHRNVSKKDTANESSSRKKRRREPSTLPSNALKMNKLKDTEDKTLPVKKRRNGEHYYRGGSILLHYDSPEIRSTKLYEHLIIGAVRTFFVNLQV